MVGITLSPEQIHQAPPEVRQWIEQQIAGALGLARPAPVVEAPVRHLVGCDLEQARTILSLVGGVLPVANVFFELARDPIAITQQGLRVLRMDDIQRHCRLPEVAQVVACLDAIDEALRRATGLTEVVLTMVDRSGHCLLADDTARSILTLWQEVIRAHHAEHTVAPVSEVPESDGPPMFQQPYRITLPQTAANGFQQINPASPPGA